MAEGGHDDRKINPKNSAGHRWYLPGLLIPPCRDGQLVTDLRGVHRQDLRSRRKSITSREHL